MSEEIERIVHILEVDCYVVWFKSGKGSHVAPDTTSYHLISHFEKQLALAQKERDAWKQALRDREAV